MKEIFEHIKGKKLARIWVEPYAVSEYGEVVNLDTGKVLKQSITGNTKGRKGYYAVKLDGMNCLVHRLVAALHLAPVAKKNQVNHKDGDPFNNHESNLEWCTGSENQKHAWDTGLQKMTPGRLKQMQDRAKKGREAPRWAKRKYTVEQVKGIREDYANGMRYNELEQKYNANRGSLYDIIHFSSYKEV